MTPFECTNATPSATSDAHRTNTSDGGHLVARFFSNKDRRSPRAHNSMTKTAAGALVSRGRGRRKRQTVRRRAGGAGQRAALPRAATPIPPQTSQPFEAIISLPRRCLANGPYTRHRADQHRLAAVAVERPRAGAAAGYRFHCCCLARRAPIAPP
jgi:hypothetical protein